MLTYVGGQGREDIYLELCALPVICYYIYLFKIWISRGTFEHELERELG